MKKKLVDGVYVLTKENRGTQRSLVIEVTAKELETIAQEARKTYAEIGNGFFKHLSPDVSFYFKKERGSKNKKAR